MGYGMKIAALLGMICSGSALAQEAAPQETAPTAEPVTTAVERQLTLPGGKVFVDAFIEINLSKDFAFKPVSLAPDVWYGVSDDLTLGLVHSGRGATGLFGGFGDSLCLTGTSNGCAHVYDKVGLDARYHLLRSGGVTLAADGGLFAMSFDPFALSFKLGGIVRWQTDAISLEFGPSLLLGLTERGSGNKEVLTLPATFMYSLSPKLGLAAQLGMIVPFANTDLYMFGASLGAQYFATDQLILDAAFSLPAIMGGSAVADGVDLRTFTLGVAYAF